LLSGLKIQNAFKNAKMGIYMSVVNWLEILRDPAVTYTRKWRNMERLQPFLSHQRKDARNRGLA
jgi:hypothetical protein